MYVCIYIHRLIVQLGLIHILLAKYILYTCRSIDLHV